MQFTDAELDEARVQVRKQCKRQGVTFELDPSRSPSLSNILLGPLGIESTEIDDAASAAADLPAA